MSSNRAAEYTSNEPASDDDSAMTNVYFRDAPVAMLLLDEDMTVRAANPAAHESFGTSRGVAGTGRAGDAIQCVHTSESSGCCGLTPDCRSCGVRRVVAETFLTGRVQRQAEAKVTLGNRRSAQVRHVLVSTSPIRVSGRLQVLTCLEDISAHKETTEELRESDAKFRLACETANIAVCTTDLTGRFTMVNREMCNIFGYTEEEFLSISAKDITHADDLEVTRQFIQEAAAGEAKHGRFVKRYLHKSGRTIWGEVSSSTLRDPHGDSRYFVTFIHDITERKQAEDALRISHDRLAEAQQIAHLGNWTWNVDTNEMTWSEEVYRIFGLPRWEFQSTFQAFLQCVHAKDRREVQQAFDESSRGAGRLVIEHRIVLTDGSERIVREKAAASVGDSGRPRWISGTVQDVTEQKEVERKLRDSLRKVERLKDRLNAENTYLREEISGASRHEDLVGESEIFQGAVQRAVQVAGTDSTVLLLGESGTGKELFARAIHRRSSRSERPLVKVNCATLPDSLIESELFGHIKGAFTGAVSDRSGRFQLADGGTIFLDEIGDLELDLQAKLLRFLEAGEFEQLGSTKTLRVNVRVIAATNRNIRAAMQEGSFREDLYYRLAVFPIEIPPLRRRRDDIPALVRCIVENKQRTLGKPIRRISDEVLTTLTEYDWPGNVRELENVVEQALILSPGPDLMLAGALPDQPGTRHIGAAVGNLEQMERQYIASVLADCGWKIKGAGNAAERLGLKPSTLYSRMKKLHIQRPQRGS
jgi:PAS domain S-box-containing protein